MADDEAIVYDFSLELQDNQSVSDATYARAVAKFGEPGVVELASIQGYYTYLAMVMSAARVTTQPDTKPALERFPRLGQGFGQVRLKVDATSVPARQLWRPDSGRHE